MNRHFEEWLLEEGWLQCETLSGDWWYENTRTGEKLPLFTQPIPKYKEPENCGHIKIPKIDIDQANKYKGV